MSTMTATWDGPITAAEPSHRGTKRQNDAITSDTQRITKRLRVLNLDPPDLPLSLNSSSTVGSEAHGNTVPISNDGSMQIEETPNRIYIHDIDQELSEAVSQEELQDRLIFVPEIDRKLAKLPISVLIGEDERDRVQLEENPKGNELVLYQVPSSLTLPKEQDSVRKAILESRARLRKEQLRAGILQDLVSDHASQHSPAKQEQSTHAVQDKSPPVEDAMDTT